MNARLAPVGTQKIASTFLVVLNVLADMDLNELIILVKVIGDVRLILLLISVVIVIVVVVVIIDDIIVYWYFAVFERILERFFRGFVFKRASEGKRGVVGGLIVKIVKNI